MKATAKEIEQLTNGHECVVRKTKSLDELIDSGVVDLPESKSNVQQTILPERTDLQSWEYVLPWPPSVNTWMSPFVFKPKNGIGIPISGLKSVKVMVRMILSKRGKDFSEAVFRLVKKDGKATNTKQKLSVLILLYSPDKRLYDIDNRVKAIFDALQNAGVFVSDYQIDELNVKRMGVAGRDKARAHVMINEIS